MATFRPSRTVLLSLLIGTLFAVLWPLVARAMTDKRAIAQDVPVPSDTSAIALTAPPASIGVTDKEKIQIAFTDVPVMVRIANAESTYCLHQTNPSSTAKGCFQILTGTWNDADCVGSPFDTDDNIACARKLYDEQGTKPWLASKDKW